MGYHLWYSKSTKIRRNGTRIKEIEENLLSKFSIDLLYEPLLSAPAHIDSVSAAELMVNRDFDLIGVKDDEDENIGYIHKNDMSKDGSIKIKKFNEVPVVSIHQGISTFFEHFIGYDFIFIHNEKVIGIVTAADFNKPVCRIYIFSVISMFEMHLNFWITESYEDSSWENILSDKRLEYTHKLFGLRKGDNEALSLLECAQLCDKKNILLKTEDFLKSFDFTKGKFKDLLENVEKVRNAVAHSQNSIIANIGIKSLCKLVHDMLAFIRRSDEKIETLPE